MSGNISWSPVDAQVQSHVPNRVLRLEQRHAICMACEHWRADARMGTGMCLKCGCSGVKLWLAPSTCPDQPPRWDDTNEPLNAAAQKETINDGMGPKIIENNG